ncbi:MAG: 4'-phosphopantetheinyl transferase superfamily protein [Balneolales bacterium]
MKIVQYSEFQLPQGVFLCYDDLNDDPKQAEYLLSNLSGAAGLDDHILKVFKEESGKPYGRIDGRKVGISVTHTRQFICCGLYLHGEIGIDMESRERKAATGLRKRITHQNELSLVADVETIRIWTIKEAVLKLTGTGLRTAMKKVEIRENKNNYFKVTACGVDMAVLSIEIDTFWLSIAYLS